MHLESNKDFDKEFDELHTKLLQLETPDDFEKINDFAKRFLNEYGFGAKLIEMIYLLGYLAKDKTSK